MDKKSDSDYHRCCPPFQTSHLAIISPKNRLVLSSLAAPLYTKNKAEYSFELPINNIRRYVFFLPIAPYAFGILLAFALWSIILLSLMGIVFVSGARCALFSLQNADIAKLKKQRLPLASLVYNLLRNTERLTASVHIISYTLFAIGLAALIAFGIIYLPLIPYYALFPLATLLWTVVILLFENVVNKYACRNAATFAAFAAVPFALLNRLTHFASSPLALNRPMPQQWGELDTLPIAQETSPQNNTPHNHPVEPNRPTNPSQEIARGMAKFRTLAVKHIMCNRIDMYAVDIATPFPQLCKKVIEWGYSRVPVYDEDLDNIIGVLYTKELLKYIEEDDGFEWQKLAKEAYCVPQNKKAYDLLKEMQANRMHIAIAVDEFGSTAGLVTLEDILEEIVGDIRDEYDEEEDEAGYKRIDRDQYIFSGRTLLADACRAMQLPTDTFDDVKGEAESVAGLLIELSGKFPEENETISHNRFFFTVLTRRSNRIDEVKVILLPENMET